MAPEFSGAATNLTSNNPPVRLAKIDGTKNKKYTERFGMQGFPTLHWFKRGTKHRFTGGGQKEDII